MTAQQFAIAELEDAIRMGPPGKRVEMLQRLTDLFLHDADRLNESQIAIFDDVLGHLIKTIEIKAKRELSQRLAMVRQAPIGVIHQLARDDESKVAEPVLTHSSRLADHDLIEIAQQKSQQHLLAIAGRGKLAEGVTDVLVDRGNRDVRCKLVGNTGAQFSVVGFTSLVKNAEGDERLTEMIGGRTDLPLRLLRELISKATSTVRARLLATAPPERRDVVQQIVSKISSEIYQSIAASRELSEAQQLINSMQDQGTLNEEALLEFLNSRQYEEAIAALAALCSVSIELIEPLRANTPGLLVVCKIAKLSWPSVKTLLMSQVSRQATTAALLAKAQDDYAALSESTALRTLGFWKTRFGLS